VSTTTLYAELVVVGSGVVIFILLLFYSLFGNASWFTKLQSLTSIGSAIYFIPVLSVIYLLGIVIANVSHLLFERREKQLRSETLKNFDAEYEKIRNDLYTLANTKDLVEEFEFRRSKVRICRGWFVNSILIIFSLSACLLAGKIPCSVAWFWIITVGLLAVGSRVSWRVATETELQWFRSLAEQQARDRKHLEASTASERRG